MLDDLKRFDWIAPPHGTPRRNAIERLFAGTARKPKARIETSSLDMQRTLLTTRNCITLLTNQEMAQDANEGVLTQLPYEPDIRRLHDGIALRKGW
jgi:LysR family transcriptional regulator of gallate degradation